VPNVICSMYGFRASSSQNLFYEVILQKSMPAQIRQLVIYVSNNKGYVGAIVRELTCANQLYVNTFCEMSLGLRIQGLGLRAKDSGFGVEGTCSMSRASKSTETSPIESYCRRFAGSERTCSS